MARSSRRSGSGQSHTWSSTSGYTGEGKPQNSSRWYYRSKPATNGYNCAYVDHDKLSSIRQEQRSVTEHECKLQLQRYEILVQKYGRDSMTSTTIRKLLIDHCGAFVDPDKPSRVSPNSV